MSQNDTARVLTLCVGPLEANCHIVYDSRRNAVLIDPGAEAGGILHVLEEEQLHPLAILLTHAHFDHFCAAAGIMAQHDIPLYVHALDAPMLNNAVDCLAVGLGLAEEYEQPDPARVRNMDEGDVLEFSPALKFTVLHTPGHSPGSCCFDMGNILFTGDVLFRDGVGRVDFQGGDLHAMRASLARLGRIEGDRTVYCGHYGNTTLEHERTCGHYLIPRKL